MDDYKKIIDDYRKFCMNCGWNVITDLPEGCICPSGEEIFRHFPQIIEVLEQIKGEADGK